MTTSLRGRWKQGGVSRPVPFPGRAARALALGVLLIAGAAGCGDRAASRSGAPPPVTLRLVGQRIRGFDPARAGDAASAAAYAKVYEGLLRYSWTARPYRLVPNLAAGMPEISADGLVCTVRLRHGIRFADDPCFRASGGRGRELTAADFVYSWKRVADPRTGSSGWWAFQGRIVGLDDFRDTARAAASTDYDLPVAGLETPEPYTLRIRLTRPYPQLPFVLAMHYAFAVPREAVEAYGDQFGNHPVGTGPYVLASWRRNYRMEFVRNPSWAAAGRVETFDPPDDAPLGAPRAARPAADRLVYLFVGDPSTQWQLFLRGELDWMGVGREAWARITDGRGNLRAEWRDRGFQLVGTAPGECSDVFFFGFNMDDPVVGRNRALRQALSCAFDRDAWLSFYTGRAEAARGPIPPDFAGYRSPVTSFVFDPDRARALLAQAGYPGGLDPATGRRLVITLDIADAENIEVRQSTDLFRRFMDRVGVVIEPRYNNRNAFFERLSRRQCQMFRLSWSADYPDPQNFLQVFYGPNASPGSNRTNFRNSDYDRLYEELSATADPETRARLMDRMVGIILEECPWIFAHHSRFYTMMSRNISNFKSSPFEYSPELHVELKF